MTPGIYTSDVTGHVFNVQFSPTIKVTCLACMESCARADFKTLHQMAEAAKIFVEKHGALDQKIANSIVDLLPEMTMKVAG